MLTKEQTERWDAWVAALESGDFVQAQFHLKNFDGSMCCLGLACHLVGAPTINLIPGAGYDCHRFIDGEYFTEFETPMAVSNLYGFPVDGLGFIVSPGETIASYNDSTFDPNKADYSNVLPEIKKYLAQNRWVEGAS